MRQRTRVTSRKPFDLHLRFPRSLCRSCSYGHIPGFAVPARGKRRWTGATPPFCCPVRARGCCATYICAAPPREGRSRPNYPWREGQDEERGPGGPVPPDPPVAPEPRAAHQADREPDARSGWASPPEPPGCEETHTNQKTLQRGIELRLDDLTPLWKIKDFPQGASFCFQFSLATDLPSPQPHPCRLLFPLDRWKQDRVLLIARAPDLADHLTGGGRAEESPFPRSTPEAPGHRLGANTQPSVRSLWANTGQMAGSFFHDLTRIPAGGGFKRHLGGGRIRAGLRGGAGILREGPILMGRDK